MSGAPTPRLRGERPHVCSDRPLIVFDGSESIEGRALLIISALYWCAEWLPRVQVRFCDVTSENVGIAAQQLRWDTGISVSLIQPLETRSPLYGADLYAAIAFRSVQHLRLPEAASAGVPAFVAVQFPSTEEFTPSLLLRQRAAFDPRVFAEDLQMVVGPWL